MISLKWLESQLLLGLDPLLSQLDHLPREHSLWRRCRINAIRLDTDDHAAANLQELMGVEPNDTRLIRLCDVGEDAVYHRHQHAVLERMSGVLNDRDDVRAM